MRKNTLVINALIILAFVFTFTFTAQAQQARSYIASHGRDERASCTREEPCRSFNRAMTVTDAGGEVVARDSGNYEAATVTKSITLSAAPGASAGIHVTSGNAITVAAGIFDKVVLRGLTLHSADVILNTYGVNSEAGAALHVEDCAIKGFRYGIFVKAGELFVNNTTLWNNNYGIHVASNAGNITRATINNSRVEKSAAVGIIANSSTIVTVRNTIAAGNGTGFLAQLDIPGASPAVMMIENSTATHNGKGMHSKGGVDGTFIYVSNSTITLNEKGLVKGFNGLLYSRGNNTVEVNPGGNGTFVSTFAAK